MDVVIVTKRDGLLHHRTIAEEITTVYDDLGLKQVRRSTRANVHPNMQEISSQERDAFDTLFDHAPDKLQVVKKSLVTFVNKHLNKVNLDVYDLESQFSDGVFLCLLVGLLEGYFVPLYDFYLTPQVSKERRECESFCFLAYFALAHFAVV